MSATDIVEKICNLPSDFRSYGDVSAVDLVLRSNYLQNTGAVTRESLANALSKNTGLIKDWLLWSEDKRTQGGWYFEETADGYVVDEIHRHSRMVFSDPVQACAEFVFREVTDIAKIALGSPG